MSEAVDATDEEWCLSVLILYVSFYTATDQKLDNVLSVAPASDMQRRRQLRVHKVWLSTCPFKKEHEKVSMT